MLIDCLVGGLIVLPLLVSGAFLALMACRTRLVLWFDPAASLPLRHPPG